MTKKKICPGCGSLLDEFGLCPEALARPGLDLAAAWRVASQSKRRITDAFFWKRVHQISSGPLSEENAGDICCLCHSQFFRGICPRCGLERKNNSPAQINRLFMRRRV